MKRLPERLTEQEFTIGQFAFPMVEEICSLRLETIGFVLASCLPQECSHLRPGAGNACGIAEVILKVGLPGHECIE